MVTNTRLNAWFCHTKHFICFNSSLIFHLPHRHLELAAFAGLDVHIQNEGRRRFTLAHELGHHLLRHSASFYVDFVDVGGTAGDSPGYNWQHERAANEFAANLLMPADLVRAAFRRDPDGQRLATTFAVSRLAMGFRLAALGLRTGPLD